MKQLGSRVAKPAFVWFLWINHPRPGGRLEANRDQKQKGKNPMLYFSLYLLCIDLYLDHIGIANESAQWLVFDLWLVGFWVTVMLPYAPERQTVGISHLPCTWHLGAMSGQHTLLLLALLRLPGLSPFWSCTETGATGPSFWEPGQQSGNQKVISQINTPHILPKKGSSNLRSCFPIQSCWVQTFYVQGHTYNAKSHTGNIPSDTYFTEQINDIRNWYIYNEQKGNIFFSVYNKALLGG